MRYGRAEEFLGGLADNSKEKQQIEKALLLFRKWPYRALKRSLSTVVSDTLHKNAQVGSGSEITCRYMAQQVK